MNDRVTTPILRFLPYVVGGSVTLLMLMAGLWQLDRAGEKRAEREAFAAADRVSSFSNGNPAKPWEHLEARGRWLADRSIVLENIIVDGRIGHYIVTPLETGADEPLLLVNRGFVDGGSLDSALETALTSGERQRVAGRVGRLPRAGYRMGEAIPDASSWPVRGLFPNYDEVAAALGRDVQPFTLLLDPDAANGFERHWQPQGMGPARHTGYAVQWFLMAVVLTGLMLWHARRKSFET